MLKYKKVKEMNDKIPRQLIINRILIKCTQLQSFQTQGGNITLSSSILLMDLYHEVTSKIW